MPTSLIDSQFGKFYSAFYYGLYFMFRSRPAGLRLYRRFCSAPSPSTSSQVPLKHSEWLASVRRSRG